MGKDNSEFWDQEEFLSVFNGSFGSEPFSVCGRLTGKVVYERSNSIHLPKKQKKKKLDLITFPSSFIISYNDGVPYH